MIFKALTTGLIIGLLVGCGGTSQNTTVETIPTPEQQTPEPKPIATARQSKLSVAETAKLTPVQVKALQPLNDASNPNIPKFKILVPTFLPPGFEINKFKLDYDRDMKIGSDYYRTYTIDYKNPKSNTCFYISGYGFASGGGGDPGDYKTVEVSSAALGKVVLMFTEFSQYRQNSYVRFKDDFIFVDTHVYDFTSPSSDCNTISVQEAVKIVESFQWLNP